MPCAQPGVGFDQVGMAVEEADPFSLANAGVILADFDGDDRPELVALGVSPAIGWWDGSGYALDTTALPVGSLSGATSGAAADIDADGDLDLVVVRERAPVAVIRNDGGQWVDVSSASGLPTDARNATAAAFADADGDGDLDLALGAYGDSGAAPEGGGDGLSLWENAGDGRFIDISDRLPAEVRDAWVLQVGWADLDGDGTPELLSIHDFPWVRPSMALRHNGSVWVNASVTGFLPSFSGMGLGVGDLEGDGVPDLLVPGFDDVALLRPLQMAGELVFVDQADAKGLVPQAGAAWSAHLTDLDADGFLDAFTSVGAFGDEGGGAGGRRDALWMGREGGFSPVESASVGLGAVGAGRGAQLTDIDGDGWTDVVVAAVDSDWTCHRNACNENGWILVRPRMPDSENTFAVGTRVCAIAAGFTHCGWVNAGGNGMFGSGPPEVHLGLGAVDVVDTLVVSWPDGTEDVFEGVTARQVMTVRKVGA